MADELKAAVAAVLYRVPEFGRKGLDAQAFGWEPVATDAGQALNALRLAAGLRVERVIGAVYSLVVLDVTADLRCWLIERSQLEGQDPPAYVCQFYGPGLTWLWTTDPNAATKFATQREAEDFHQTMRDSADKTVTANGHIAEHVFLGARTENRDE